MKLLELPLDSAETNLTSIHEDAGLLPGLVQWVQAPRCHEQWWRSQMWLRPRVAVAVAQAGSCSSDLTHSLGTSMCRCTALKRQEGKERNEAPHLQQLVSSALLCTRLLSTCASVHNTYKIKRAFFKPIQVSGARKTKR